MEYHYPPKKPRPLTPSEIKEIEECWDLVSEAISEEIERQRLESEALSKRNFTGLVQGSCKGRTKGSRRRKQDAA
ncbi:unnamed protein product [marine sediment metagenome]|uniref:Uncharacterized protein n=1 Tax=marine sediment metagenome TaxID=412755 RepID=X1LSN9_9ZZZZ